MNTTTHKETQLKQPIDWRKRLFRNEGDITPQQWDQWKQDARTFDNCPFAPYSNLLPCREGGAPEDEDLLFLSTEFYFKIEDKNLSSARTLLQQIKERSALLMAQIKSNTNFQ